MNLRKHQKELQQIVDDIIAGSKINTIYVNATPGSGKSMLPIIIGKLIKAGLADAAAWIVPRKALQNQGEHNFLDPYFRGMLHHNMAIRSSTNDINPCRGLDGFVTTYQAIISDGDQTVLSEFRNKRYIVIFDEFHHVEDEGIWFNAINPLYKMAAYRLLFTGTIERGNGKKIAFIPYKARSDGFEPDIKDNETTATIEYSRDDALSEKAIIPLNFHLSDGHAKWINKDGALRQSNISKAPKSISSQALFTALSTEFADELLLLALKHWTELRKWNRSARLLVVATNYEEAKKILKKLDGRGFRAEIATSHESAHAIKSINKFKSGITRILVTIAMAYEGLDVPEITHIVCLTNIRSVPWIEQMTARAVRIDRKAGPYEIQTGYIFAPDDIYFREIVTQIQKEQLPFVGPEPEMQMGLFPKEDGAEDIQIKPLKSNLNGYRKIFLGGPVDPMFDYVPETPSEIEAALRDQIEAHVRQFSFINRYNPKRLNAEIKRHFNKGRDSMTSNELEVVLAHVKRVYPLNGSGSLSLPGNQAKPRGGGVRVPTKAVPWYGEEI